MTTHHDNDDTGHHDDRTIPAGIPVERDHVFHWPSRRTFFSKLAVVPVYGWILLLYIIGAVILQDPHYVLELNLPYIGPWKISWVTFVLGLTPILIALELTHLSKPGINQMDEVMAIGICFVVQIVLVTVAYSSGHLTIFRTSEVMLMMLGNGLQTWAAYAINSNSLVRTIAPGPVTN